LQTDIAKVVDFFNIKNAYISKNALHFIHYYFYLNSIYLLFKGLIIKNIKIIHILHIKQEEHKKDEKGHHKKIL
jgi:hypothetical protein